MKKSEISVSKDSKECLENTLQNGKIKVRETVKSSKDLEKPQKSSKTIEKITAEIEAPPEIDSTLDIEDLSHKEDNFQKKSINSSEKMSGKSKISTNCSKEDESMSSLNEVSRQDCFKIMKNN